MKTEVELSPPEKKMLQTALNSSGHRVTLEVLAKESGRSINYVYQKLQEPTFKELFMEALRGSLLAEVPEIMGAFVMKAKEGSFPHGKLLLEIAGIYNNESNINIKAQIEAKQAPMLNEIEKAAFVRATLAEYLPDSATLLTEGVDKP